MGVVAMVRTLTFTLNERGRQHQVWNRIISADLPFERNILSFFKISFFFKAISTFNLGAQAHNLENKSHRLHQLRQLAIPKEVYV